MKRAMMLILLCAALILPVYADASAKKVSGNAQAENPYDYDRNGYVDGEDLAKFALDWDINNKDMAGLEALANDFGQAVGARTLVVHPTDPELGYLYIQDAVNDAQDGDTIVVEDGTYIGEKNRNINFQGKAITLQSRNGPENCIIDAQFQGRVVLFYNGEGRDTVLSGFTLAKGAVDGSLAIAEIRGGGVFIGQNCSPVIKNCIFKNNSNQPFPGIPEVYYGIGVYIGQDASPLITDCRITDNWGPAGPYGWKGLGGGIYCDQGSSPEFFQCRLDLNRAGQGGGFFFESGSTATIEDCWIEDNGAANGGGIYGSASEAAVKQTEISSNTGFLGGGVFLHGNSTQDASEQFFGCFIHGNSAPSGGGIYADKNYSAVFTNCLISENEASTQLGGGVFYQASRLSFTNCTIAENRSTMSSFGGICGPESPVAGTGIVLVNSIVYGNVPSENRINGTDPEVSIDHSQMNQDPGFIGGDDPYYRYALSGQSILEDHTSLFIDSGTSAEEGSVDIEGYERYDVQTVVNTGSGLPDYLDLGAFEYFGSEYLTILEHPLHDELNQTAVVDERSPIVLSIKTNLAGVAYQWQKSDDTGTWQDISGASGTIPEGDMVASYAINSVLPLHAGQYRCRVSRVLEGKSLTLTSNVGTLVVNGMSFIGRLVINEQGLQLGYAEQTRFTATCYDQYGNELDNVPITWAVDGFYGTIDQGGNFTAPYKSTIIDIVAQAGGAEARSTVSIDRSNNMDSDGDHIKDWIEDLKGTDPDDPDSTPGPGTHYLYDDLGRMLMIIRIEETIGD